MNDKELYKLCKKFGRKALQARRKFAGLLPEVQKRRLYERKGFSSIYEFAAKLAGMSREQVDLVIRLEHRFQDKPILQNALIQGEISPRKLVRVASIATTENQEEIFEKTKILSTRALDIFVKETKNQTQNSSVKPLFDQKSLRAQSLRLSEDIENELIEMQEKGIDINEFLRNALKSRKEKIENEKKTFAQEGKTAKTRYIPSKIKKIIQREHGTRCSVPGCCNTAKTLHHTGRFALMRTHDPHFIAPLCEGHHEIAHKIDVRYVGILAMS